MRTVPLRPGPGQPPIAARGRPRAASTGLRHAAVVLSALAVLSGCGPSGNAAQPPANTAATSGAPTSGGGLDATTNAGADASASPASTAAAAGCTETRGRILDYSYRSTVAGATVRYRVYLPPCYGQSHKRYPYVILLHGSDQDETEWTRLMHADTVLEAGLESGKLAPMILVMPGGGELPNTRIFTPGKSYESVILDEIKPAVEKRFCTLGTRAGRAIGGISRGGFWAFLIAFRHPVLFSAVGGHSPFFYPTNAPPAYNPLDLARTVVFPPNRQPRIWVDAGAQDYAMPGITPFVQTLEDRGIDPGFTLYPTGKHEVPYWRSHVSAYLAFYGKTWPRSVDGLPDCR